MAGVLLLAMLMSSAVFAQNPAQTPEEVNPLGLGMTRQHAETFEPGKPFQVTVTISAATAGQITAMGLRETIPPEWRLESVAGASGAPPDVSPAPGATNLLEFAWITIPQFPYTFTYMVTPPEGDGGTKVIHGALEYRQMTGAHYAPPVITEVRGPDAKPPAITLKGANPVTLNVGDTWQEPGYTALDGKNNDITGKVVVGGTVDTSRAAEYGLTYTVSTDSSQHTMIARTVVVKEKDNTQTSPTTPPATGGVRAAGPSGRELSNPIAASVDKNPGNKSQAAETPTPTKTEGETGAPLKKPELPDLSAFRPPATPQPGETPPTPPGTAPATTDPAASAAPAPPAAAVPPVQHRAPLPPEMLKSAAMKEAARKGANGNPSQATSSAPKAPATDPEAFTEIMVCAAIGLGLLAGLGLLGWRLVYSRPVRRKRPPSPPSAR